MKPGFVESSFLFNDFRPSFFELKVEARLLRLEPKSSLDLKSFGGSRKFLNKKLGPTKPLKASSQALLLIQKTWLSRIDPTASTFVYYLTNKRLPAASNFRVTWKTLSLIRGFPYSMSVLTFYACCRNRTSCANLKKCSMIREEKTRSRFAIIHSPAACCKKLRGW